MTAAATLVLRKMQPEIPQIILYFSGKGSLHRGRGRLWLAAHALESGRLVREAPLRVFFQNVSGSQQVEL